MKKQFIASVMIPALALTVFTTTFAASTVGTPTVKASTTTSVVQDSAYIAAKSTLSQDQKILKADKTALATAIKAKAGTDQITTLKKTVTTDQAKIKTDTQAVKTAWANFKKTAVSTKKMAVAKKVAKTTTKAPLKKAFPTTTTQ